MYEKQRIAGDDVYINTGGDYAFMLLISPTSVHILNNTGENLALDIELFHTGNQLIADATPDTARTALQLVGDWVDLRPYLKGGFFWDTNRQGKNSHPRIRKHACGRVELDGVVSFNAVTGVTPIGVFLTVPEEFRPTHTAGGIMFGDTATPLSFGAANWTVTGVDEYSPPRVHGDVMVIPLTLATPSQNGALSLNGVFWFIN